MIINPSDYVGFNIYMCGYYEPHTVALVKSILKPGMTFFDIGGHFGQYTLVGSHCVGERGRVHTFEPGPVQFSYLKRNVELNAHGNVVLNNIALGEKEGTLGFVIDTGGNLGGSHIATTGEGATIEVQVTTLDSYCRASGVDCIDAMKIDVEGAELLLLKGASNVLSAFPPKYIFYEAIDVLSRKFGYAVDEVHNLLAAAGYGIFVSEKGELVSAGPEQWPLHTDFVAMR